MLKVVIADDEPKICRMIQNMIPWQAHGYRIVGLANDGLSAWNLIMEHRPDLVITDIRMPGMDGIELVKKCKECNFATAFIVISGYRHFEYAHNALKYGVEHYLLKPLERQEMEDSLSKIRQHIEAGKWVDTHLRQTSNELEENKKRLKRYFMSSILSHLDHVDVSVDVSSLEGEFPHDALQAVLLKVDKEQPEPGDLGKITERLEQSIQPVVAKLTEQHIVYRINGGILCILNYSAPLKPVDEWIRQIFIEAQNCLSIFDSYYVTAGVGKQVTGISQISASIKTAIDAIKCRVQVGVGKIIYADQTLSCETLPPLSGDDVSRCTAAMTSLNSGELIKWLDEKWREMTPDVSPLGYFHLIQRCMELLHRALEEMQIDNAGWLELEQAVDALTERAFTADQLYMGFQRLLRWFLEQLSKEKAEQLIRPVRQVKQYVQEHFGEPISLEQAAERVGLSASYLSTLFKKESGMNFVDYLIQCRMEKAKDLLRNTNMNMAGISETVGYTDAKYFSKLFAKTVGIKPTEYRNLYS